MNSYDKLNSDLDFKASMADLILSAYLLSHRLDRNGAENIRYARSLIANEAYIEDKWVESMIDCICHDPNNLIMFRKG